MRRCGLALPNGTPELVRLAVLAGDPPGPVAWRGDGPALGITVYLARQKWTYARAWLRDALGR